MPSWTSEFQHAGISVGDLDRAVAWYIGVFGFVEVKRFRKEELQVAGAVLQLGALSLEVLAPFAPVRPSPFPSSLVSHLRVLGANHLAFGVSDLAPCRERLEASGAAMLSPVIDGRFFFCADPDGTVLEIRKI